MRCFFVALFILINNQHVFAIDKCGENLRNDQITSNNNLTDRIEKLKTSQKYAVYRDALRELEAKYNKRHEMAKVFGQDAVAATASIEAKLDSVLTSIENNNAHASDVPGAVKNSFRNTASELGFKVLHMEDEAQIVSFWKEFFAFDKKKLAQTDSVEAAEFWIDHMDPDTTFLFLDADIHGQLLAGLRLSKYAIEKHDYKNVFMVSGRSDDDLEKAGIPARVKNLQKPLKGPIQALEIINTPK